MSRWHDFFFWEKCESNHWRMNKFIKFFLIHKWKIQKDAAQFTPNIKCSPKGTCVSVLNFINIDGFEQEKIEIILLCSVQRSSALKCSLLLNGWIFITRSITVQLNRVSNIARVLALYKSYQAAMNKIFIQARPRVNKMTWAFFLPGFRVHLALIFSIFPVNFELFSQLSVNWIKCSRSNQSIKCGMFLTSQ